MTVQEAIKKNISECKIRIFRIKDFLKNNKDANSGECRENIFVLETTIQSLEEVEQYRALGTVEELKAAKEKQVAKKPIYEPHKNGIMFTNYKCPACGCRRLGHGVDLEKCYCPECGQAIDWEEGGTSD